MVFFCDAQTKSEKLNEEKIRQPHIYFPPNFGKIMAKIGTTITKRGSAMNRHI